MSKTNDNLEDILNNLEQTNKEDMELHIENKIRTIRKGKYIKNNKVQYRCELLSFIGSKKH